MIAYGTDVFDDIPHSYDPSYSQDLGPSDLRIVAHWLNTYYFSPENLRTIENLKSELTSVVGVRINCDGDVDIGGRPRYEHIELPAFHYIFQQTATDVSKHISLPIVVQRIPGSVEKWQKRLETSPNKFPWVNTAGTFLNIGCKPQLKEISGFDWGLAPLKWQNSVGSVVVMRKDKKELFPEHVHALVEYHQHHLMRFFEEASELHRDKKWVMKQITKEKFQEYYLAWTLRQAENVKVHQISPYDI